MKNLECYECEGQMDLLDYLDAIKLPDRCEDCVFLEDYKCGLKKDVKNCILDFPKKEGWKRIKRFRNNILSGKKRIKSMVIASLGDIKRGNAFEKGAILWIKGIFKHYFSRRFWKD